MGEVAVNIAKNDFTIKLPMANLDLNSIWETVKTATQSANGGSLSQSSLTNIAKDIIAGVAGGSKTASADKGVDLISIAGQLISLYEKFKGSSNGNEKQAAFNVKSISDIIGAMGGDKGSMVSAGADIIGKVLAGDSKKADSASDLGSTLGKALGGLFGK